MKRLAILLTIGVVQSISGILFGAPYGGGSGTPGDPYTISTAEHWVQLSVNTAEWNGHFILTADIDLSGITINPVGNFGTPFIGSFNGQGHIIRNASINLLDQSYLGLFGYIGPGGLIRNLGVENAMMIGNDNVGGLAGFNYQGTIDSCYVTGRIEGGSYLGGVLGSNDQGKVLWCYSTAAVFGDELIGGFCGWNNLSVPFESRGNFWDMQTSGTIISAMGMGRTTVQMQTLSTFAVYDWDLTGESTNGTADTWRMCGDGIAYPRLSWEFSRGGDMNCPDGVGMDDLLYLAGRWMGSTPATAGAADGNGDGKVDLQDFGILAENWMK